jgi:fibro-slime domain-containing protein
VGFQYHAGGGAKLDFLGDDDVWVFVNGKLAIDLGGWHPPQQGSVTLDTSAALLGLVDGQIYELAVFHAERRTTGSSFRIRLTGFNLYTPACPPGG